MSKTYQIFYKTKDDKWKHYNKYEKTYRMFENAVNHASDLFVLIKSDVYIKDEKENCIVVFNPPFR